MTIVVTGATGKLGRLAVEALLERGVPAAEIVATGRSTEKLSHFADRGITVRRADFDDPASLAAAFAGADRLLLVSGNEVGQRPAQHGRAIDAAKAAGVQLIAYTSIPYADRATSLLSQEHLATEKLLAASGVPFVLLRNSWYLENYTEQLPVFLEHGIAGSARDGRVSAAARRDYAEAAAVVLIEDGHAGAVYELGGAAFTLPELAAAVTAATGTQVSYTDVPVETYEQILVGAGLPAAMAHILADADRGLAEGELFVDSGHLEKLMGRPATTLAEALAN
ncbi:NAD(P)H dehydrogenase (quinone) [Frankineae bacterium MT45]|nr:NAD(P)H dehydrogenase (quinone) [Frankineae bacterium MT45]